MNTVIWVHGDNLNPHQPALAHYPSASSIFVWDDALMESWQLSFKRVVFIYECLLELPVVVRRGDVATEVAAFALEHGANHIVTMRSPSPRHRQICQSIASKMPKGSRLEVLRDVPFVDAETDRLDMKRFYRFWSAVKYDVMRPTKQK